jgi:hypothetical protein
MKYFTKIRVAWIVVIVLSAVNITMIILSLFSPANTNSIGHDDGRRRSHFKKECMLRSELKLSEIQTVKYDSIKTNHHEKAVPIVDSLRITRTALMVELKKNPLDSDIVAVLVERTNELNSKMFNLSIEQYLEVKKILDSAQQESLFRVYCDMFGCTKHHKECNDKKGAGKECESGKGCE